jgi:hypothetical protein
MLYNRRGVLRQKIIGFEYTDAIETDLNALLRREVGGANVEGWDAESL